MHDRDRSKCRGRCSGNRAPITLRRRSWVPVGVAVDGPGEGKVSETSWENSEVRFWGFFQIIWFNKNNKPQMSGSFSAVKSHYVWPDWSLHPITPQWQDEKAPHAQNGHYGASSSMCCVTVVALLALSELLMSCRGWLRLDTRKEGSFLERLLNQCGFSSMGRQDGRRKVEEISSKGGESCFKLLGESC